MDDRYSTPSFFRGGQLYWPAISQGHLLSDPIIVETGGKKKQFSAGTGASQPDKR